MFQPTLPSTHLLPYTGSHKIEYPAQGVAEVNTRRTRSANDRGERDLGIKEKSQSIGFSIKARLRTGCRRRRSGAAARSPRASARPRRGDQGPFRIARSQRAAEYSSSDADALAGAAVASDAQSAIADKASVARMVRREPRRRRRNVAPVPQPVASYHRYA